LRTIVNGSSDTVRIEIGTDEADAKTALLEAKDKIGKTGVVLIADRFAVKAENVVWAQIVSGDRPST